MRRLGATLLAACLFGASGLSGLAALGSPAGLTQYMITLQAEGNLIVNHLDRGNNTLNEVIPAVPQGTILSAWNPAQQTFNPVSLFIAGIGWLPNAVLPPGQGAAVEIAEPMSLVFSGMPHSPQLPVMLSPAGANLIGMQTPDMGTYDEIVGMPPSDGVTVYKWNPVTQQYFPPYRFFAGAGWFCMDNLCPGPTTQPGEALWISISGAFPGGGFGKVIFANLGPGWTAPVFDFNGTTPLSGSGFVTKLYAGPQGTPENQLTPLSTQIGFLTGQAAGLFHGGTWPVQFVEPGHPLSAQVRVWASGWSSYEEALAAGGSVGKSSVITVVAGGGAAPASSLAGLQSFSVMAVPPAILAQPQIPATLFLGDNATFTVTAQGSGLLHYQWFKGNCPTGEFVRLPGATNPAVNLDNIQARDAGYYFVEVANSLGVRHSATNELVINVPADFLQPLPLNPGHTAIAYPLHFGGNTLNEVLMNVPDGTSLMKWNRATQMFQTYTFTPAAGWLDAGLNDAGMSVTLAPGEGAFINVPPSLSYLLQFKGVIRAPKFPITLGQDPFVFAGAQLPFPSTYEALTGQAPDEGATLDVFKPGQQEYQTFYFLNGEWNDGEQPLASEPIIDPRRPVFISVARPISILSQPADHLDAVPGSDVTFSVLVNNPSAPVRYQWRLNGVNIPQATNATHTVFNAQLTNAGRYKVVIQTGAPNHAPMGTANPAKNVFLRNAISSEPALLRFNTPRFIFESNPFNPVLIQGASGRVQGFNPDGLPAFVGWDAPADGIATFETLGSSFDTLLSILTENVSILAQDDDGGAFLSSRVAFNAVANTRYLIAVDPFLGDSQDIVLGWSLEATTDRIPVFSQEPRSQGVLPGASAQFTAQTVENGPYMYEWFFNGTPIASGAASMGQHIVTLTIPNSQPDNLGAYWVVVTRGARHARSSPAWLELGEDPNRVSTPKFDEAQPEQSGGSGGSGGAAAGVAAGVIQGQQMLNVNSTTTDCSPEVGGVIGGALRWLHLQPEATGLMEFDTCGSTVETAMAAYTGNACLLTLAPVPTLSSSLSTNCLAQGQISPFIRARTRFIAVQGEIYHVAVDTVPSGASGVIGLQWKLTPPPTVINGSPSFGVVKRGQSHTLSAPVLDQPPPRYQWTLNGLPIAGATNAAYSIPVFDYSQEGLYSLVASNAAGVATYQVADLIPGELGAQGSPLTLENLARPGGTTYQWGFNGTNINGATAASLVLPSFDLSSAGEYFRIAAHESGTTTNRIAAIHAPVLSGPLLGSIVLTNTGSAVTLEVTAQGFPTPSLQWYLNGTAVDADEPQYQFTATTARTGSYSLVASNIAGVVKAGVVEFYIPPQLVALGSEMPGGPFRVKMTGWPGSNYLVEINGSVSPSAPAWQPFLTNQMISPGLYIFSDPQNSDAARFYRVTPYGP